MMTYSIKCVITLSLLVSFSVSMAMKSKTTKNDAHENTEDKRAQKMEADYRKRMTEEYKKMILTNRKDTSAPHSSDNQLDFEEQQFLQGLLKAAAQTEQSTVKPAAARAKL